MAYPDSPPPPGDTKTGTATKAPPGKSLADEIGSLLGPPKTLTPPADTKTPTRDTKTTPPADTKTIPTTAKKPPVALPGTPPSGVKLVTDPLMIPGGARQLDKTRSLFSRTIPQPGIPPAVPKDSTTMRPATKSDAPATPAVSPPNRFAPLPKVDYDSQKQGGTDVKNTRPDATPPKYDKVPHDQDKRILKAILKPSKAATLLYNMYLETYTDRSEENKVPDSVRIAELHKGVSERVKSVELLGDSEMFQKDQHGIVLHPTGQRHPGNFYALLRDDKGIPVNIIEYTTIGGKPKYLQQWIFDRDTTPDGGRKTTISYFRESGSTAMGRPAQENGKMADVFMGRTEYTAGSDGVIKQAIQYNNLNKPTVQIDYGSGTPAMQLRDPNSGELRASTFSRAHLSKMALSHVYLK